MRVALEAIDVAVGNDVLARVDREVANRIRAPEFSAARDLRLRLRQVKGAFLGIVIVGFSAGDLITSTATSNDPLDAMVSALDGLPGRMDRIQKRHEPRPNTHAKFREELRRLLARA
jgi:hypothetical protein